MRWRGFLDCGGLRRSILLKTFLMVAALAAVGGVVLLGFTGNTEVRGSSATAEQEPVTRAEGVPETVPEAAQEAEAADALLSDRAEELQGACCGGVHVPRPTTPREEGVGTPAPADERVAGPPS
jgi:hypothetical protein